MSPAKTYKPAEWEKIVATVTAIFIVGLISFLVIRDKPFSDPNFAVFVRILLSLACAVLGAVIPGFLHVSITGNGLLIRAGGALALFVITFFFSPSVAPLQTHNQPDPRTDLLQSRIEMLEATVKFLASKSSSPTTSPSAAKEIKEVKESLETIIKKAKQNPDSLLDAPLDIAVIVAHGPTNGGAIGTSNGKTYSEFTLNSELAPLIVQRLASKGLKSAVFFRREDRDIRSAVVAAAARTPALILELHANASNGVARGSEALIRPDDPSVASAAEAVLDSIQRTVGIPKRFVRAVTSQDRGGAALYATTGKAILLETFFIDNAADLEIALTKKEDLSTAIADAIATNFKP